MMFPSMHHLRLELDKNLTQMVKILTEKIKK